MAPTWLLRGFSGSVFTLDVLQSGGLAAQRPQVVQLCASNLRRAHQFDLIEHAGAFWKDALDALAEADLAHCETCLRSSRARDYNTFKCLQALLIAFLDFDVHANGIARNELGKVGPLGLGQQFFN